MYIYSIYTCCEIDITLLQRDCKIDTMENNLPGAILDSKKCYSCGKVFRTPANLAAHKNRKTPCLIREIAPENIHNPNRCIYCNKVFSKKSNLTAHFKICKIKNGGMNILDEKVRYEQEIRILKEQRENDKKEIEIMKEEFEGKMQKLQEQMRQLNTKEKTVNINNGTINNTTNNITINFYNYDAPKIDTLKITQDDLITNNVSRMLMEKIYFNKDIPENHVLYLPNIKERRLLVFKDGSWKNRIGDDLIPVFTNIKNAIYNTGNDKINGGAVYKTDEEFTQLYPAVQEAIKRFNFGEQIAEGTIMEIITENRELIKATMDAEITN